MPQQITENKITHGRVSKHHRNKLGINKRILELSNTLLYNP